MLNYFSIFPRNLYRIGDDNSFSLVTNLTTRFTIESNVKENIFMYFKYDIKDGESPEVLSAKIYGTPFNHWLILMLNDIVDVENQWPLDSKQMAKYLNDKYGDKDPTKTGIVWSQQNTHSYYKVISAKVGTGSVKIEKFRVDVNTYNSITSSYGNQLTLNDGNIYYYDITKETKDYFEYETEENDKKRTINLLKKEYIPAIEQQVKSLMLDRK
jgi:hypothetical protein